MGYYLMQMESFLLSEEWCCLQQREILRIQKENEETISSVHALTASMFKANEKMEQFQYLMQWNKVRYVIHE